MGLSHFHFGFADAFSAPLNILKKTKKPFSKHGVADQERDSNPIITLDVGGRQFKTYRETLKISSCLYAMLGEAHGADHCQSNGSYFIDADPNVFEHLLSFMRRPTTFPLFWDYATGFDFALYQKLQDDAERFNVESLYQWIKNQEFRSIVWTEIKMQPIRGREAMGTSMERVAADAETENYVFNETKRVYLCPTSKSRHRGKPERCGKACMRAKMEHGVEYEDEVDMEVVRITKTLHIDYNACKDGR